MFKGTRLPGFDTDLEAVIWADDSNRQAVAEEFLTNDFTMAAGMSERWYRFVTLGDGQPGSFIRVTPGARQEFVEPTGILGATTTAAAPMTVGADLFVASLYDSTSGGLYVGPAFTQSRPRHHLVRLRRQLYRRHHAARDARAAPRDVRRLVRDHGHRPDA